MLTGAHCGKHCIVNNEPPMVPSRETEIFTDWVAALASGEGREFVVRKRGGLSAANFVSPMLPVCIDGMGPSGGGAHSVDEFLCIDSIGPDTDFLAKIIALAE